MDRRDFINAELRASTGDEFVIEGKALSYNSLSVRGVPATGMCERIAPGCFRASLADPKSEVFAYLMHDPRQVLARTGNGSLVLKDGTDALRFRMQLDRNIQAHRDAFAAVKSGLLNEMSFGFVADKDEYSDGVDTDGNRCKIRTVKSGRIAEISLVHHPAYGNEATDAQARQQALDAQQIAEQYSDLVERYERIRIF